MLKISKIWLLCLGLLIGHQFSQKYLNWFFPFLDNYLDPFLSIPILLGAIQIERIFFLQKVLKSEEKQRYQFSFFEIIVLSTFFALLFEEAFPRWSNDFTRDIWDYLAYFLGAGFFYTTTK